MHTHSFIDAFLCLSRVFTSASEVKKHVVSGFVPCLDRNGMPFAQACLQPFSQFQIVLSETFTLPFGIIIDYQLVQLEVNLSGATLEGVDAVKTAQVLEKYGTTIVQTGFQQWPKGNLFVLNFAK